MEVTGIHHVGLSVTDLDRSLAFYEAATSLEATVDPPVDPSASQGRTATLRGPNCGLELIEYPGAQEPAAEMPVQGPGITHVCYQSATADNLYGDLLEAGATPVSRGTEPVDLGGYGVYYAYARDPDGIIFEVEHLDRPHFDGDFWIAHVALASTDLDRLVDFYEGLLGMEPARRSDNIHGPQFDAVAGIDGVRIRAAWFDLDNMILELWQFLHPEPVAPTEPPPTERIGYTSIAFAVDAVASQPRELRDPDGNLLRFVETR